MDDDVVKLRERLYRHTEVAAFAQISKWVLNKRIQPYRSQIGTRNGHWWHYTQVEKILTLLDIPYTVQRE